MEDFYCVHVDRSMKSMNSDLQFCRYNRTPMKVASTKYEVATSIFTIFMPENVYMHQIVFTTTIDTMLLLSVLQKF